MSVKESPWSEGKVFKNFKRPRRLEKFIQETYMDMWWAWGCILISLTLELDSPSLTVALILVQSNPSSLLILLAYEAMTEL